MTTIVIQEGNQTRKISSDDFPIKIGTDLNSDILIVGSLSLGIALIIDLIDDRLVLQKINPSVDTTVNDNEFSGNYWIKDGDELIVSNKRVQFKISANQIELNIENVSLEEQPTQFQKRQSESIFQNKTIQRIAIGLVFLVGYFLFYLFTSKAVEINTIPADAKVSVSGGFFPHLKISGRFLLRPGEYRADYSRSGYFSNSLDIEINEESSQVIDIKLKKTPGIVRFITRPDVVYELYLEGKFSPFICEDMEMYQEECRKRGFPFGGPLEPGTRDVELRFEKYFPIKEQLIINGMGEEQEFIFDLKPAWADVEIDTKPSEAEIFIDGKNIGLTPLDLDIMEGQHTLEIKKNGFKNFTTEIAVKAKENIVLELFNLSLLDSKINIISNPKEASVNINSIYRGLTPLELELEPLVSHTISLAKPGFKSISENIVLKTQEEILNERNVAYVEFERELKPIYGSISFLGTPGAGLILEGEQIGVVPINLDLLSKKQLLLIKKEGYVTEELMINPTSGYEQTIEINLMTPEEAALAALPNKIQTSQGLEMRLIYPGNEFVMGAPRRDQGRKTNETERLVKITRPFYVGITETSNKEFREFEPKHTSGAEVFRELSNNMHPTVMVSWQQAVAYCNWLSTQESLEPAYKVNKGKYELTRPVSNGYRLLTEAEWEWLSRFNGGGGEQKYPWGDSMPVMEDSGNYADESAEVFMSNTLGKYWDGYPVTSPTGKFKANSLGVFDLGGNVAEWVNDYYSVYPRDLKNIESDPLGPLEGSSRMIKGSSWRHSSISALRYSFRDHAVTSRLDVGFRIARYSDKIE